MKPRKSLHSRSFRKKPAITFDESSRKEYLTGFQKRKKQRKRKAELSKINLVKKARKELREKKKEALKKKLDVYGLDDEASGSSVDPALRTNNSDTEKSCTYEDHPNHLVVINTNPDFGNSLSALVNDDEHETIT